jgi:hypothetical protein
VRWGILVFLVFLCATIASAQEQERTLIDRLLRPNMELHNHAQRKAFTADSKVAGHQQTAATFATEPAPKQKTFADAHTAATKEYSSRLGKADLRSKSIIQLHEVDAHSQFASSSARDVRPAYDARLAVSGRSYPDDERVFREQGKSQKSLDRQNPPLTIDQVRELLNKNK